MSKFGDWLTGKNADAPNELNAIADQQNSFHDRLEDEYQSGLAVLRRVRQDAMAAAEFAEAKGKLLLEHSKSLLDKFSE